MQKNREFLNCFWDLAVDDAELRVKASSSLLSLLSESESITEDSDYTTKRLVRGLSSSRESARQGFSSCLTELMSTDHTSVQDIISAINESTKVFIYVNLSYFIIIIISMSLHVVFICL